MNNKVYEEKSIPDMFTHASSRMLNEYYKNQKKIICLDNCPLGSLIIFFDLKTKEDPDDTGCNQIGILIEDNKILFCRNFWFL